MRKTPIEHLTRLFLLFQLIEAAVPSLNSRNSQNSHPAVYFTENPNGGCHVV